MFRCVATSCWWTKDYQRLPTARIYEAAACDATYAFALTIFSGPFTTRARRQSTKLYSNACIIHCVSKNDTDVAHHNFNAYYNRFWYFLQRICWVSTQLNGDLLSHLPCCASALPGETWNPEIWSLQSCCIPNNTDLVCYIFHFH